MSVNRMDQASVPEEFLRDESRLTGRADSFSFPESQADVMSIVCEMAETRTPMTIQGARTGITGGAVPDGGHVINCSRMKNILGISRVDADGEFFVEVQAGLPLAEFNQMIAKKEICFPKHAKIPEKMISDFRNSPALWFPPDPTETSATLGGMASCNASGAKSYHYGSMRNWIHGMRVVLPNGDMAAFERGQQRVRNRQFKFYGEHGGLYTGDIPAYSWRSVKNAAGYFTGNDIDLADLFIGQEGTLGIVTSLVLKLVRKRNLWWGILFQFSSGANAVPFVNLARQAALQCKPALAAVEFFDKRSCELARTVPAGALALPDPDAEASVYLELHGDDEASMEKAMLDFAGIADSLGEDPDASVLACDHGLLEKLSQFRHAVPEAINLYIASMQKTDPGVMKLGSDFAVADKDLPELVSLYRSILQSAGLEHAMFGHIGNNHLHVNILPKSRQEFQAGREAFARIAGRVILMNGTISAEHGVGKLKRDLLTLMYGETGVGEMRECKRVFDPYFLLNRGNLFL